MDLKLACSDFTFPLLDHDRVLELISLLGFKAVDIGVFERRSHHWPSKVFKKTAEHARRVAKQLRNCGLKPCDVYLEPYDFTGEAINHPSPTVRRKVRSWFKHTIDFTLAIGGKHISTLPGGPHAGESFRDSQDRSCDELEWRVALAREEGLTLGIEPHAGSVAAEIKDALAVVKRVPGLTLTLDYTHFCTRGIKDEEVDPLLDHTSHFHVRGARKGWIQAGFANNVIDYARILRVMKKKKYTGYLEVEYVLPEWDGCEQVDNLSQVITWRDYLRKTADKL